MPASSPILDRPQRWDAAFDPEMKPETVARILQLEPFRDMKPENFPKRISLSDILMHDVRVRRFRNGEIVVREGDYGTSAFMIISGTVRVVLGSLPASVLGRREPTRKNIFKVLAQIWSGRREPESFKPSELKQDSRIAARKGKGDEVKVFLQDVPRVLNENKTAVLHPGEFFGELAALSRMPRTATVFAQGDETELLEIRWQGLRDLMRYDDQLRTHIDTIYRVRALASALREIPIFSHLSDEDLQKVIEQTEFGTYGDYDWSGEYKRLAQAGGVGQTPEPVIAQEGDYPNGVIVIRAGFARLSRKFGNGHRTLNYLGAGRIYGLEEIAHNWRSKDAPVPLQHSLRVIGYTHVLVIPTAVMESVVLPNAPKNTLPDPIPEVDELEETVPEIDAAEKIGADTLEFLTENRFFNGTASMLIDLDRCTRCDDCVRACAAAHENNPRFLRHGPSSGKIMVANACMHCVDPVCMIGCPTGAIHRDAFGGQVVINPTTCIGCKACYNNCPYDAIRMVEIRDETGAFMVDKDMKPIIKATKCDLCVEQMTGPACQRACPHGALARVNLNELDTFARWLKR
ncbi:MAG TPA: cyclic nucleotide-binding domain-containing protein [Verrucomicrobiae bacterium]|nr:cyclic nucleotide-binding domain-containing protein [Verrucomicrobiae bacterium]